MPAYNRLACVVQSHLPPKEYVDAYDRLPKRIRKLVSISPYQLCTLCIEAAIANMEDQSARQVERAMRLRIRAMEQAVRDGELRTYNK